MYAGTPALMVNLWSVESQSAKLLNTGFYRHLKTGTNRAESLRRSKVHLIHGEKGDHLRHPFFWAPSVIFGDGS
jgi:CHAT domain-containing protein